MCKTLKFNALHLTTNKRKTLIKTEITIQYYRENSELREDLHQGLNARLQSKEQIHMTPHSEAKSELFTEKHGHLKSTEVRSKAHQIQTTTD